MMGKCKCEYCGAEWSSKWSELGVYVHVCKNKKEKFTLQFDEPPALLFIQEKGKRQARVIQNGKEVKGITSIRIEAKAGELTTHTIEYLTSITNCPPL